MKPRFRLAFFDVDSTLVTIEGIDVLAGGNPEIVALTDAAMSGRLTVEQVYARRLEIIRPTRARIEELAEAYQRSMLPDAESTFDELRHAGVQIHLVTAGIEQAILPLAAKLAVPPQNVHAVRLEFDREAKYTGFDRLSPLTRTMGKETVVMNVRSRTHGKAVFVGDGVTDLETAEAVDLFIGFGGVRIREEVRKRAAVYITEPRLREVLQYILEAIV